MLECEMALLQKLIKICSENYKREHWTELESILKNDGGKEVGEGTSRKVFRLNSDYVAKIPSGYGDFYFNALCNLREYLIYTKIPGIPLAHCGLYFYKMIPVIVMETLDTRGKSIMNLREPGNWNFQDCFQGGVSKDGQYLSYDCGYEQKLLEKFGKDFTPFEFSFFSKGHPNFLNLLKDERTEYLQESLVLTP